MSDSEAFTKWLAWAKSHTNMFTEVSTDNGQTWGYQYHFPEQVAREAWQAAIEHAKASKLDALATEVLRASHHGDQHVIQCLTYSDPTTTRLRLAIVALADYLREQS